jgi:dipeptide transport system substrate-binding protein
MRRLTRFIAALALACGAASIAQAKTLTYCLDGIPEGFDPAPFTTAATFDASSQALYNRLVEFRPGTTKVGPGLAQSWEVSEDGLTYTFHLRQGVAFHTTDWFTPTRPLNADDVVFSFDRQANQRNPYFAYAGGQWPYYTGMAMATILASIEKVDDATVRFVLTVPQASFVADLAMDFASIVSKEYADKLSAAKQPGDLNRKPVGTGPFQFVEYTENAMVRYKANPAYWAGKPGIDDLVFVIVPDGQARWKKLKDGACQVMANPDPSTIAAMKADANLTVTQLPRLDVAYLAYNTTQPPYDRPEVRRALNMAINKQALVDVVFRGAGTVAKTPVPPTMWGYNGAVADDAYDPDAAKAMLDAAGVSELKFRVWALPVARSYNPDGRRMAELIKADLAKVGVEVEVISFDWGEYLRRSAAKDRDGAVLFGWTGDNGDPDSFLSPLLGCDGVGISNRALWCDTAFNDLLVKARVATSEAARATLYQQAQVIFKDQAPWLPIAHSLATVAMSKAVTNYVIDPLGHQNFAAVGISEQAQD